MLNWHQLKADGFWDERALYGNEGFILWVRRRIQVNSLE